MSSPYFAQNTVKESPMKADQQMPITHSLPGPSLPFSWGFSREKTLAMIFFPLLNS